MSENKKKRIAIACQGGGSHTAFTSGVLQRILSEKNKDFEVVAVSGTSGGALCASLYWYAMTGGCGDGNPEEAGIKLLADFWKANSIQDPVELATNKFMMQYTDLVENFNLPTAEYNPNKVAELTGGVDKGKEIFKKLLWDFIQFDKVEALIENFTKKNKRAPISLYLGAVDVLAGKFHHFTYADLAKHNGKYGAEAIIASACIPTLFTPVELNGTCYWDGLFSENPPVVCLAKEIVDEMWIIRINPRATPNIPRTTYDIDDRRNELSGNLALELALDGIHLVNRMLRENAFSPEYIRKKGLKPIDVKEITVVDNTVRSRYGYDLGGASKLDRDPQFIAAMTEHGYEQAEEFFLNRKKEVMQAV